MRLATPAEQLEHRLNQLAARHFANGSVPHVVLCHRTLTAEEAKRYRDAMRKLMLGAFEEEKP